MSVAADVTIVKPVEKVASYGKTIWLSSRVAGSVIVAILVPEASVLS